ncbi:MAG: hypothetical protein AAFN10_01555 [Bacteroidota bacterium]
MKPNLIICSLLALLALSACRITEPEPFPDPDQGCDFYNQNPDWIEEDFKTKYSIRFTPDYDGGITGFEGNLFFKTKGDSSIAFYYAFCSPTYCEDFGASIQAPLPDSIEIPNYRFQGGTTMATYAQNIFDVCDPNEILGVLYFTEPLIAGVGTFYLGDPNGSLREAVYIEYDPNTLSEVVTILGTIEEK